MERGNKKRIIFWSIITIFLIIISIYGIILTQNGYGDIGYIMTKTKPIVNSFNNLNDIKALKNAGVEINAKAKNDTIEMHYKTDNSNSKFKFDYKVDEKNNEFIVMEYYNKDDAIAKILIRYMIDAICVNDGYQEKEVFKYYKIDDFKNADISKGANINTRTDLTIVTLNINHSVLDSLDLNSIPENIEYINEENASKIITDLVPDSSKIYKTDNIILHIDMFDDYYTIYINDTDQTYSNNLYLSVTSLIKVLSNDELSKEFNTIINNNSNNDYTTEQETIVIKYDVISTYEEFKDSEKILEVKIKK